MRDYEKWTLLFTRALIVFIFLWHGLPKAFSPSMASEKFIAMGFPGFLGPIIGWVEVIGAILILAGLWWKWANYVLAAIILVAVIVVHLPNGVTAGLERDLLIIAATLTIAVHGPGPFALHKHES